MAGEGGVARFRLTSGGSIPNFYLHLESEGSVDVSEQLLYLKYRLPKISLLLEREEFDEAGAVTHTVYQKPLFSDGRSFYKIGPNSYTVVGGILSFDLFQASAKTPESCASLERKNAGLLKQMLAPVKESKPLELLSYDDEDDCIPLLSLKELNNRVPS